MSIKMGVRLAALLSVLVFCGYMLYMLIGGATFSGVSEQTVYDRQGNPVIGDHFESTKREPYLPAMLPLTLALIAGMGFLYDRLMPLAWIGIGLLALTGFPLIFGLGIFCWGLAASLVAPAGIIQAQISKHRVWLLAGAVGTLILLWGGWAFRGGAIGWMALAAGAIYVLLLAWLIIQSRPQQAQAG